MNSQTVADFWERYRRLPQQVRRIARQAYRIWNDNPRHPSLQFKKLEGHDDIYSVRVGLHYRAVGLLEEDTITWFWIGTHAEFDQEFG